MRGRLFNISQTFLLAYLQVSIIRTEFSSLDNLRSVWTPDSRDSGHTYSPPALPQETWYVWPEGPSSSWELTPFEHFPVCGGSWLHKTPVAALDGSSTATRDVATMCPFLDAHPHPSTVLCVIHFPELSSERWPVCGCHPSVTTAGHGWEPPSL